MLIPHTKWEGIQKKDYQTKSPKMQQSIEKGSGKGYDFDGFTQDLFSSLYQADPKFPESASTGTEWAKKALDELKSLPEFEQLRNSGTKYNSFESGIGSSVFAKHFAENLPKAETKNPDDLKREIENIQDFINDIPEDAGPMAKQKFENEKQRLQQERNKAVNEWQKIASEIDPAGLRQTFRRAIAAANEEIKETNEGLSVFGFGDEPGQDGYGNNIDLKQMIAATLKQYPKLKEIAKLAGRFRREAAKKQSEKKQPGPDELADIETGNDLARLIPAEAMKMRHPYLKYDFRKKYLERTLIQYKLEEIEKEDRGPIVFCIDNSGSMAGQKEVWSKAMFMGMAQVAFQEKRTVCVIHFDTDVREVYVFNPKKMDPQKFVNACLYFSGGGTSFDPPLERAMKEIIDASKKDLDKADIVFITDGIGSISGRIQDSIKLAKKHIGLHLYSIIIGTQTQNNPSTIDELSDEAFNLHDIMDDEETKPVKDALFSI